MTLVCSPQQIEHCLRQQAEVITRLGGVDGDIKAIRVLIEERNAQSIRDKAAAIKDCEEIKSLVVGLGEHLETTNIVVEKGKLLAKVGSVALITLGGAIGWAINLIIMWKHPSS